METQQRQISPADVAGVAHGETADGYGYLTPLQDATGWLGVTTMWGEFAELDWSEFIIEILGS